MNNTNLFTLLSCCILTSLVACSSDSETVVADPDTVLVTDGTGDVDVETVTDVVPEDGSATVEGDASGADVDVEVSDVASPEDAPEDAAEGTGDATEDVAAAEDAADADDAADATEVEGSAEF